MSRQMNIGIDISQMAHSGTGVARFTRGLVQEILRQTNGHTWKFIFASLRQKPDPEINCAINDAGCELIRLPIPPTVLEPLWNRLRFPSIDSVLPKLDWFITSDWTEPPASCKKATIVHDLIFCRYPETVHERIIGVMKRRLALVAAESHCIFCDSHSTKNDLISYYPATKERVVVNYPGLTPLPKPTKPVEMIIKKYGIERPYYITVGKREPRKNLGRLLDAYRTLRADVGVDLCVVGARGWGEERWTKRARGIHFLGHVPDSDLAGLYLGSYGLIFPSLWEGFGYPAVEAMALGVPVALSNTSSLAEIAAGEAALTFDPESIDEIADALRALLDPALRKKLIERGSRRASYFSWQKYYQTLISTLEQTS